MTCRQNSLSAHYAQYMFKVDAQAAFPLNVRNIFIQSKLHTYQNIATKKAHAGVCHVIKKNSIKIHIPRQDGDFRKYTGSLVNFIVQNHTYNLEMSL